MTTAADQVAERSTVADPVAASVLFPPGAPRPGAEAEPDAAALRDLHLDRIIAAVTRWRDEYDLGPLFRRPTRDTSTIAYRHEVMRDLDDESLVDAILAFARGMRVVRQHRSLADSIGNANEKAIWLLESARVYVATVRKVATELRDAAPRSRALRAIADHLDDHVSGDGFVGLADDAADVGRQLSAVTYRLDIADLRITVGTDDDPVDFGADVERTFDRFRHGPVASGGREQLPTGKLNDVEMAVLDRVARLHPGPFGALQAFRERHADHLDPTVVTFDREIQFYLAFHDHVTPLRNAGLPLCYPDVDGVPPQEFAAEGAYDLALATKLVARKQSVVSNDVGLDGDERILVVSGANQGGKTTFARMVGQLHHLAGLGCPVPARRVRVALPDRVFTHFSHEEHLEDRRGRLQDDLIRVRDVLDRATADSVVILNEIFSSTTLADARELGTRVMDALTHLDCRAVYVTFVDELAAFGPSVVSMVATVEPDDPAIRTFNVERRPADGQAFARALADKHGLTYEQLLDRLRP